MKQWATYGLQLVVVTHSPAFVNAADPDGIRLARKSGSNGEQSIVIPVDSAEIRSELGVQPADILLARQFLIVEGPSDRVVLDLWARRLGIDLGAHGVQLVGMSYQRGGSRDYVCGDDDASNGPNMTSLTYDPSTVWRSP